VWPVWLDRHARKQGLITRFVGGRIAFSPPLIITEAEIDGAVTLITRAMDDTCGRFGRRGSVGSGRRHLSVHDQGLVWTVAGGGCLEAG
jgi:hypothetical protein